MNFVAHVTEIFFLMKVPVEWK